MITTEIPVQQDDVIHVKINKLENCLLHAKELIQKGWCKGRYHKKSWFFNDKFCVIGALREATNYHKDEYYSCNLEKLQWLFCKAIFGSTLYATISTEGNVTTWNDRKSTTKQDVLNAFDKTIEFCKQKGN
jgi:hypothetical protein